MKKILIIILTLAFINTKGQVPPPGSHKVNTDIDEFVGTWISTSGFDTITIILQKQVFHYPPPLSWDEDMLVGWHKYVKNGIIVENDLQNVGTIFTGSYSQASLFGTTLSPHKVYFTTFRDLSLNKTCDLRFSITTKNIPHPTAIWILSNPRGARSGLRGPSGLFTFPKNMVFIKQ
ncbi:MAG: hypothetical protein NTX08_00325 [Sphingobacteriales bacterium]|jgi:hypothetical protein|nr:hypothetical protein [Sphingobacteriales bacterium]